MTELSFHPKKGWKKRLFALCLTLCMVFSVANIPVFASTNLVQNLVAASTSVNGSSSVNGTLETGDTFSKSKLKYKVTGSTTVAFTGTTSTATKITVPATVTVNGVKYKVTSIAANAFKNNKTVKTIVVGTNVKKIGSSAFTGCTKLTTLQIKSTKITDSGLNVKAFKGVKKTTTIKVPSSKVSSYKKIFRSNGLSTTVTVKKY
jgi:hypothetical protein